MIFALCDDDLFWCELAQDCIRDFCDKQSVDNTCIVFQNRQELTQYEGKIPDILFMDIELEGENGIRLIEQLDNRWKHCQVVYLTNYLFYATEVYSTRHIYYVLKEQFQEKLPEVYEKALHEISQREQQLIFTLIGGDTLVLHPKEILYMERDKRITEIVTFQQTYKIKDKIDQLASRLPSPDFAKCHNSILIYFPSMEKLNRGNILMKNGMELPISRNYRKSFSNAFFQWAQTQIL